MDKAGMENTELTFKQHEKALITFSASILKNFEDAQDVVQEVFMECFEKNKEASKAYLFKSVRNRSLNKIRSNNRLLNLVNSLKEYWDLVFPLEFLREESSVWEMLTILPPKQKEVLLLRIKGDLKINEIAEILGVPEGTIKSRLNIALGTLRKRYSGERI